MRYIIYGAGAIGGVIGARLFQHGHETVLIARGAMLDALRRDGLLLRTPDEEVRLHVPVVAHPREIAFRPDDAVILTMKTQDTDAALRDLEAATGADVAVICCQNGVENERLAARRFARVYGMLVAMPATYLIPGEVDNECAPISGVLDTGCYPRGVDDFITRVAADISAAKMSSHADPRVMRLKYTKLLANLGNAINIVAGELRGSPLYVQLGARLRAEALACYRAAGIDFAPEEEYDQAVRARYRMTDIRGRARGGSSTMQSLQRGHSVLETDYLNGEIVMLGRLYGVPTPLNSVVRRLANAIAAGRAQRRYSLEELDALAATATPV